MLNLGNGGDGAGHSDGAGSGSDAERNGLINIANGGDALSNGSGSGGSGSVVEAATGGTGENDNHAGDEANPTSDGTPADGGLVALANGGNSAGNGDGGSGGVVGAANGGAGKHEEDDENPAAGDDTTPVPTEPAGNGGDNQGALISVFTARTTARTT